MAYYYSYLYQRQHRVSSSPDAMPSELMTPELTKSLPPLLLLSPPQQQQQLTLPLLTPIQPIVSMTTNSTPIEHNEQQLPTPNTFFKHCEDLGLFNDIQHVVVMSPSTGLLGDLTTTTVSNTATTVSSPAITRQPTTSNLFGSSTAVLKTMMMTNPFDETFKQAVLQQQQNNTYPQKKLPKCNNNDDGELNTPFIEPTNVLEPMKINNILTMSPICEAPTTAVTDQVPNKFISTSELQRKTVITTTSKTEVSTFEVLDPSVMSVMVEQQKQQQPNSMISIQPYHKNHVIVNQQCIAPTNITNTNVLNTTTKISHNQVYCDGKRNSDENGNIVIYVENNTTKIKQTLKKNLLGKKLLDVQQNPSLITEKCNDPKQLQLQNNQSDAVFSKQNRNNCNNNIQENDNNQIHLLEQKKKQEILERNRTSAKRSRMKRKKRWELLSEENRLLKIENIRLRNIISKLMNDK